MDCHRTTARGILFLLPVLGLAASAASARPPDPGGIAQKPVVRAAQQALTSAFPVIGKVLYTNDFGAPRSQGAHQGNDLMAARKAPVVAVEPGTVRFHTTSGAAGCMLYLYGKSGATYYYIHLNNDVGTGNDNRGKCVAGTAYAPGLKNDQKVVVGQHIGYVGDSGDANGGAPHLHFEYHPGGGSAVSPFSFLNKATRLLFPTPPSKTFTLALTGEVAARATGTLDVKVNYLRAWPGGLKISDVGRTLSVRLLESSIVERVVNGVAASQGITAGLRLLRKGQPVVVWTAPAATSLDAQVGRNGALSMARVVLVPKP